MRTVYCFVHATNLNRAARNAGHRPLPVKRQTPVRRLGCSPSRRGRRRSPRERARSAENRGTGPARRLLPSTPVGKLTGADCSGSSCQLQGTADSSCAGQNTVQFIRRLRLRVLVNFEALVDVCGRDGFRDRVFA